MGYELQAIVAPRPLLENAGFPHRYVIDLRQGMQLLLLKGALLRALKIDEIPSHAYDIVQQSADVPNKAVQPLADLIPGTSRLCCDLSKAGPLAYIEADFFGGIGGQVSALFRDGHQFGQTWAGLTAINLALEQLGVTAAHTEPWDDEFAALNLGKHRQTSAWVTRRS